MCRCLLSAPATESGCRQEISYRWTGTVRSGDAMVNESSLTGEPLAVLRKEGHTVYAGTAIEEGNIEIEVQKLAGREPDTVYCQND